MATLSNIYLSNNGHGEGAPQQGIHWLQGLVLAAALVAATGCRRSLDKPIRLIVPSGYTGWLAVVADSRYPDLMVKRADCYEVAFSSNGVLCTNNADIFHRWHRLEAVYEDGTEFPTDAHGNPLVSHGPTGTRNNTTYVTCFFVGPYEEKGRAPIKALLEEYTPRE